MRTERGCSSIQDATGADLIVIDAKEQRLSAQMELTAGALGKTHTRQPWVEGNQVEGNDADIHLELLC